MAYARSAASRDLGVVIAGAGGAAHLAGVIAAVTTLPVIGVPIALSKLDGLDSLLSMVQMPRGIPVATVAIDGARNAGLLAARILALGDAGLPGARLPMRNDSLHGGTRPRPGHAGTARVQPLRRAARRRLGCSGGAVPPPSTGPVTVRGVRRSGAPSFAAGPRDGAPPRPGPRPGGAALLPAPGGGALRRTGRPHRGAGTPEEFEQLDRDREDQRGVALRRDLGQCLQGPQLHRTGRRGEHRRRLGQLSRASSSPVAAITLARRSRSASA